MEEVQEQQNNPDQPQNDDFRLQQNFDEEDSEKRRELSSKFYTLSASIDSSIAKMKEIIASTEIIKFQMYISMSSESEQGFISELNRLNESIGAARSILDSYIEFKRSQPDFEKFLNVIYQIHEFIEDYTEKSIFYHHNLMKYNKHLYPLKLNKAVHKLSLLFSRLCGTLRIAGDYILDLPQMSRPSSGIGGDNPYWRDYGSGGGYGGYGYDDWRRPFADRDFIDKPRRKTRDIGDIDDKL